MGKVIENYYGKHYDIELGIDADLPFPESIIILQVRPESVWSKKEAAPKTQQNKDPMERLLSQLLTGIKVKLQSELSSHGEGMRRPGPGYRSC